jgi:glycosyltransferase involved in cell wall biosynthesis
MSQETASWNIECILIDDCSPDNSMIIAREMVNKYQGSIEFKILKHQQNKGLSEARNTGLRESSGDYVFFIDSDDYLMPNSLAYMLEAKKQNPDTDVIIGNVYEHKYNKNQYNIGTTKHIDGGIEVRRWMLNNEFAISAWNKLFSRQLLIDNNLFFEPGILYEDIPWTYQLYSKISSILLLPNVTYGYWYNESSISSSSQPSDKAVRSFVIGCKTLLNISYEAELYVPQKLFIFRWLLNAINARKNCSSEEILKTLFTQRRQLMRSTLYDFRLVLASFFLLMYQPFNAAFKLRFFRRNYNHINWGVRKTAELFNFMHRH